MDTQKFKEELVRQATIFAQARSGEEAANAALEVASSEILR